MSITDLDQSNNTQHSHSSAPDMLTAALWYARRGWHVFPLHAPVFDEQGDCAGCTCEEYKRSEAYRLWLKSKGRAADFDPEYTCPSPGKHPRGASFDGTFGFQMATTDEAQILHWWRKWPTANIGWYPGPSGHAVLDADKYKDEYDGENLLDGQDTVTQMSGIKDDKRGEHYVFSKPDGVTYSNSSGSLPAGIDVRADGGYVVVAPSMHPSGVRYQWEADSAPHEIDPAPLPDFIHEILTTATAKASAAAERMPQWNGTTTTTAPDFSAWTIPAKTLQDIVTMPSPGHRSESDYRVCLSLIYCELTDDDILSVFEHCAIGTHGKFAERGRSYLSLTIGKARAYADEHPQPKPVDVAILDNLSQWIAFAPYDDLVPLDRQSAVGYRTRSTDKRVSSALADIFRERKTTSTTIGKRRLSELSGVGTTTVGKAVGRLAGWFVDVIEPESEHGAYRYTLTPFLVEELRRWTPPISTPEKAVVPSKEGGSIYATPLQTGKSHDAFCRSMSDITEEEVAERNAAREFAAAELRLTFASMHKQACAIRETFLSDHPEFADLSGDVEILDLMITDVTGVLVPQTADLPKEPKPMVRNVTLESRLAASMPSAGPDVLLARDALFYLGDCATQADIRAITGQSKSSMSRTIGRGVDVGLFSQDDGVVSVHPDWLQWADDNAPSMPTAGTRKRRIYSNADDEIRHVNMLIRGAKDRDELKGLHARKARAINRKVEIMSSEMPDTEKADVIATASQPATPLSWLHRANVDVGNIVVEPGSFELYAAEMAERYGISEDDAADLSALDDYRAMAWPETHNHRATAALSV